jgi:hypothetical protein
VLYVYGIGSHKVVAHKHNVNRQAHTTNAKRASRLCWRPLQAQMPASHVKQTASSDRCAVTGTTRQLLLHLLLLLLQLLLLVAVVVRLMVLHQHRSHQQIPAVAAPFRTQHQLPVPGQRHQQGCLCLGQQVQQLQLLLAGVGSRVQQEGVALQCTGRQAGYRSTRAGC